MQRDSPLLSVIPELIRRTCSETAPPTPDFLASFRCRPGGGISEVRYSHALSGPLMTEYFIRRLTRLGVERMRSPYGIRLRGSCDDPTTFPAVEEWHHTGRAGHEDIGRARLGNADGRVVCYIEDGTANIEWTTTFVGYHGHAKAADYARLLEWWRTSAGPLRTE